MINHTRSAIAGLAGLAAVLVITSSGVVAAQDRPNIDAIVRQFHVNYSNNQVEKNGALIAEDIIVELNGGASSKPNGATFRGREQFVNWLKQDKVIFPDGKITDHEIIVSLRSGSRRRARTAARCPRPAATCLQPGVRWSSRAPNSSRSTMRASSSTSRR